MGAFVSILAALVLYIFLRVLRRHQDRFFEEGEVELGLLLGLLAGWPTIVLLVPGVCLGMVAVSFIRLIFFKKQYTTLGIPFLVATFIVLLWGEQLLSALHLGVLRI